MPDIGWRGVINDTEGAPKKAVALWLLLTLVGCARVAEDDRVTWICAKTGDSSIWNCSQQRMRNGVPVGPVIASSIAAPAATAPENSPVAVAPAGTSVPTSDVRPEFKPQPKVAWTERLPGLQEGQLAVAAEPVPVPLLHTASSANPPPEPEPVLERWAAESNPPVADASQPAAARESAAVGPYTVQIGAFNSAEDARAFIDRYELRDLGLEVRPVDRDGREYQVVTFGSFATAGEATAAWGRAAGERKLDFWVRQVR